MPILVDGNNLLHRLPKDRRSRDDVRSLLLEQTRFERISLTVVFDGPEPEGGISREHLGAVTVRYSGSRSADSVILSSLPESGATDWTVVTDDRELARAAKDRGARIRSVAQWLGRRRRPRRPKHTTAEPKLPSREVAQWQAAFEQGAGDEKDEPTIVHRRRRKR